MVKLQLVIISVILVAAVGLSTGVRIIIMNDSSLPLPESVRSGIENILASASKSFKLNPDERPARYGLVFHITGFKKSEREFKKVVFVRDDRNGSYVSYAGSYYRAYRTLYKYDYKKKRYIPSKYGNYVRLMDFIWARDESEKYVYFTGFYRKVVKYISDRKCWLYASLTFIDFKTSFILFQKSFVINGSSYTDILNNIKLDLRKEKMYSEKPTIAFYESSLSPLGSFVKKYFYEEERYTMYDRSYLNYLFKEMKYQDLISGGEEVGTYLKPARYLVVVKILNSSYKLVESTEYIKFSNPVNGEYIDTTPVYPGMYYRFDLKSGKYIPDRKNGGYVKVKKGAWAIEDEYISAGSFNDLFIENVPFHSYFIDALVMVIDGKNGNLKVAKKFTIYIKSPKSMREDRFGSVAGKYKEEVIESAYEKLGKEISDYVRRFFAIEAKVSGVKGNNVDISAGRNYGVKRGYYFRIIDNGFTQGYVKITDVKEKSSASEVVRYLEKSSKIKIGNDALEDFDYKPFFGVDVSFNMNSSEIYTELGYTKRDIYASKKFSLGMILGASLDGYALGGYGKWYLLFNKSKAIAPKAALEIIKPYKDTEENDGSTRNSVQEYTVNFKAGLEMDYPFYESIFKPHLTGVSGFIYWSYPRCFGVDVGIFYSF